MADAPLPGATAITSGVTAASVTLAAGDALVWGWSVKEAAGAAAEVWLVDGNDANGNPFAFITLAAGESIRDLLGGRALWVQSGIVARVVSGTVQVSVWYEDV